MAGNARKAANTSTEIQDLYRNLVESSQDLIWRCDTQGHYTYLNPAWETTFGYTVEEMLGHAFTQFQSPEHAERDLRKYQEILQGGSVKEYETVYRAKDGRDIDLMFSAMFLSDETGAIVGTCGLAYDITARKQAEERLLASEKRFKNIVNASTMGIHMYELGEDGRLVFIGANPAADRMIGIDHSQFIGMTIEQAFPGLVQTEVPTRYRDAARNGAPWRTEQIDYNEGQIRGAFEVVAFQTEPGKMVALFNEITERKRAEAAQQANEKRYRLIVENITDALFIHDLSGKILDINEKAYQMLGYSRGELVGIDLFEVDTRAETFAKKMQVKTLVDEGDGLFESEGITKDGRRIPVQVNAKVISREGAGLVQSFVRDITGIKKNEELLRNAQKLESLGILAGGIAHDFNNLLGGIFGMVDLAHGISQEPKVKEYLNEAMGTMNRAQALTQQLLTFSKGGVPVRKVEQLFPFLRETANFALSGSNVSCNFSVEPELWSCHCDRNQIGQVIDNILINAQQAMPMGGTIAITASNMTVGEKQHASLRGGRYIRISVTDQGVGIPREIISRIFDPFFTTKQKGSGLGLAISYSIINRHDGCIDVESQPGHGTIFHVYLPASDQTCHRSEAQQERQSKGTGKVLLMEDEPFLRDTVGAMLSTLGYECVGTADGAQAIDALVAASQSERPFRAAILDLTIPGGMGGIETIQAIRRIDAHIPVFVSSGYADDAAIADPRAYGFTDSIRKPFRTSELAELLARNLT